MEPIDKIHKVLNDFGMTGVKAADAMGIAYATFKSKNNPNNTRHSFNEKNHQDLISFIKKQAEKL
ncbi:hypothetical protein [Flavobacterium sp. CF136]|uniref:hypothetical protein n=1 Tax=Flavobacterium sp. (strain CF136) TaxID=1144313 RepID=UPI0002719F09|nr:hypothetical protein [Flavobacterium sp. CF136]EJL66295.1 hypothetical protein PMI10_00643 [Flavobacterium sp. CF136]